MHCFNLTCLCRSIFNARRVFFFIHSSATMPITVISFMSTINYTSRGNMKIVLMSFKMLLSNFERKNFILTMIPNCQNMNLKIMFLHLTVEDCKNRLKFHVAEFRFAYWSDGNKLGFVITAISCILIITKRETQLYFQLNIFLFFWINNTYEKSKQHSKETSVCGFSYWTE